ncbi:MAG TPA: UDP-N-acetylmuramate dehydrogenase [Terriglobales bacterium]|nr:UDP-N-acetylmuramate dehydrogenase [Terriglobales bacterium]
MKIQEYIPLAPLTTFQVGGAARYFIKAETEDDVREAVSFTRERGLPLFVLAGGSNLVVSDSGWDGVVIKIAVRGITQSSTGGKAIFEAGAGEDWDSFVAHTVSLNCGGIECLSGIPGTVGGTPVQNVGAYGQEVADTITRMRILDLEQSKILEIENRDSGFAYRTSIFNSSARGRYIVLRVSYALTLGAEPCIKYADLKKFFGDKSPTLHETRDAVRQIRRSKAMLLVEGDVDCRSAGSFFKNPMVTQEQYDEICHKPATKGERVPQFPAADGRVKISAAWLVEHAGFSKGFEHGAVGISSKHALAIINRGGARAADIVVLKNEIQQRVQETFGLELNPEPVFVGKF